MVNNSLEITIDLLHTASQSGSRQSIVSSICNTILALTNLYHVEHKSVHIIYVMTPFKKVVNYFRPNARINSTLIGYLSNKSRLYYNYECFTNPLTPLHVNSGVTVTDSDSQYITIWRTEEFEKVLIHELIHFFELEKCTRIRPVWFNISNNYPHYPKELLTELQTWYLYIIYRLAQKPHTYTRDDLQFALDYERVYSLQNLRKITSHFKISNLSQLLRPNHKYIINASSSILYYYLVKAILLYQIDPVVERTMEPGMSCRNCCRAIDNHLQQILNQANFSQYFRQLSTIPINDSNSLKMMKPL